MITSIVWMISSVFFDHGKCKQRCERKQKVQDNKQTVFSAVVSFHALIERKGVHRSSSKDFGVCNHCLSGRLENAISCSATIHISEGTADSAC